MRNPLPVFPAATFPHKHRCCDGNEYRRWPSHRRNETPDQEWGNSQSHALADSKLMPSLPCPGEMNVGSREADSSGNSPSEGFQGRSTSPLRIAYTTSSAALWIPNVSIIFAR